MSVLREFKLPPINSRQIKQKREIKQALKSSSSKPLMAISKMNDPEEARLIPSDNSSVKLTNNEGEKRCGTNLNEFVLRNASCYKRPLIYSTATTKIGLPKKKTAYSLDTDKILHDQIADSKKYLSNVKWAGSKGTMTAVASDLIARGSSKTQNLPQVVPKNKARKRINQRETFIRREEKLPTGGYQKWWAPVAMEEVIPDTKPLYINMKKNKTGNEGNFKRNAHIHSKGQAEIVEVVENVDSDFDVLQKISSSTIDSLTSADLNINPKLEWLKCDVADRSPTRGISTTQLQIPDELSVEKVASTNGPSWLSTSSPLLRKNSKDYLEKCKTQGNKKQEASLSLVNIGGIFARSDMESKDLLTSCDSEPKDPLLDEYLLVHTNDCSSDPSDTNEKRIEILPKEKIVKRPTITTLKFAEPCTMEPKKEAVAVKNEITRTPTNTQDEAARGCDACDESVTDVTETTNKYAALFQKCDDCLQKDSSYKSLMDYVTHMTETNEVLKNMYNSFEVFDTRLPKNRPRAAHPKRRTPHVRW